MYVRVLPREQQKKDSNKHKNQLNKIEGWNRDGRTKKYTELHVCCREHVTFLGFEALS